MNLKKKRLKSAYGVNTRNIVPTLNFDLHISNEKPAKALAPIAKQALQAVKVEAYKNSMLSM